MLAARLGGLVDSYEMGSAMEFETLEEAVASAKRLASILNEERYVLKGTGTKPFWTCGPDAKQELWPMVIPVRVVSPGAG